MSNFFATASGHLIDIMDLKPSDIKLDDLAHHLAKVQRFGGASPINYTYSVGEHSINLCRYFYEIGSKDEARCALLHDASEAYLSDIVSPVKRNLKDYMKMEEEVMTAIYTKYHTGFSYDILVMDRQIVLDEVAAIMPDKYDIYRKEIGGDKVGCKIFFNNPPPTVKQCFLQLCKLLEISD